MAERKKDGQTQTRPIQIETNPLRNGTITVH